MKRIKTKIEDGKIKLGKFELKDAVRNLSDGYYAIVIKEWKSKRSLDQNALYWKWITIIGEELGYYKNEMHETFLDAYAPVQTIRDLEGKPKQKSVRSSQMTVKQMSDYMMQIEQFAAENNIAIPHPEPEMI